MNPKPYTDSDRSNRLWWYLLLITLLSAFCFITLDVWLLPCSIAYHETGTMTAGYLLYAAIGLLFSTPTPFIAVLIISLFIEKKPYLRYKRRRYEIYYGYGLSRKRHDLLYVFFKP